MQTLAYFSGPWQETDRAAVLAVLEQIDRADADGTSAVQRWTCNLYPSQEGALFTAARYGVSRLITARSADELAVRLHALMTPALAA